MKKVLALVSLILCAAALHAQNSPQIDSALKQLPSAVKCVCGPYLQNVTTDGFTVMWVSDIDALGWVELAPDDGTHFYHEDRPKYYDMTGNGINPLTRIHTVRITGLQPGTRYRYRIMMKGLRAFNGERDILFTKPYGADVYRSKPPVVTTVREEYDKLHFAVVNDIHEHDKELRELFKDARGQYDFVVFNGDMTSVINREMHIAESYLKSAAELFANETPLYVTRGNHEYRGLDAIRWLSWYQFPGGRTYYTFQYGQFFFIALDSGEDKPDSDIEYQGMLSTGQHLREEAEWLRQVTASDVFKNAKVRIVFSHIPPRQKGWLGDQQVCDLFVPVLNEAGIDLMICAHEHRYSYCPVGTSNADFPVVVNKNVELMTVDADSREISLRMTDPSGKETHRLSFPVRR